jgi:carbon-monoxide dehydrogenase small subunit
MMGVSRGEADDRIPVVTTINGASISTSVEPRLLLTDFLRDVLHLTATKVGCEHGACGACSLLVNGELVRSCLIFAVQVAGREVTTLEGVRDYPEIAVLSDAMRESHALQCGFCTPGMIMASFCYLRDRRYFDESDFRDYISGNLCRCTGYEGLVNAVRLTQQRLASGVGDG